MQTSASSKLLAKPNSTLPAPYLALVSLPLFLLVVRLRLRASEFPRCVPDATRTRRSRVAYLACVARLLESRAYPRPAASPSGPWNLPARAPPSSRSTPRLANCFGRPPPLAAARTALGLLALNTLRTKLAAGSICDSAALRASWAATRKPPRLGACESVRVVSAQPYLQSVAKPLGLSTHRHRRG